MRKHQEGFTLLELVVVMFCTTIVIGAAMTVLLSGLRVETATREGLSSQQTAHTVLTLVERITSDGKISTVETVGDTDWMLLDEDNTALLSYNKGSGTLTTAGGTVLMEEVSDARAELSDEKLLTVTLETGGERYTVSSFCRTGVTESVLNQDALDDLLPDPTTGDEPGRAALLIALASQYGSDGRVLDAEGRPTGEYFSQWCEPSWPEDTPWCACYVLWGIYGIQEKETYLPPEALPPKAACANVDHWMEWFKDPENGCTWQEGTYTPDPGDLVFFDWSGGDDPAHVGAVFYVDETNGIFYTIEGNSGGKVRLHVYPLNSRFIVGYGILNWIKPETEPTQP